MTWALRSLYTQVVHTHLEGAALDIQTALFHTFRYAVSRVKAKTVRAQMENVV